MSGDGGQGAAYVFSRSGITWSEEQKLLAEDGTRFNSFGTAVGVEGDTALVGAPHVSVGMEIQQGRAYFFEREPVFELYLPIIEIN